MKEFLHVVHYEKALEKLISCRPPLDTRFISIKDACNSMVAKNILSFENLPAFNRSTVDGYAFAAEDVFGCSESSPGYLEVAGEVRMGLSTDFTLTKGQCCWIPTGGMLPAGANAVVMVEYTEKLDEKTVLVFRPVAPYENVMQIGEDITIGRTVLEKGKMITPADIGMMASLGITSVEVFKAYKVGIISTGDEIVPIDKKLQPGEIRDVNSHTLFAAVRNCGGIPTLYPLVDDEFINIKQAAQQAMRENDIVLLSGGSSVGIMDATLEVLMSFNGAQMLFHGIAVKPGKPTLAVQINNKLVIGLPGHPVSALTVFYILIAPLLRYNNSVWFREGHLVSNLASQAGRDDFIPAAIEEKNGEFHVRPLLGKSGLMSILSCSRGFIHVPYEMQGLLAGEKVKVIIY